MPRIRHVSVLLLAPLTALFFAGCPTLPPFVPCGEIPANGCPIDEGGSCDDPSCSGVFACENGVLVSQQVCPTPDGGFPDGGPSNDGGPCTPLSVGAMNAGVGCMPDLEAPDCPIEAAGSCVETACLSGCLDFYVCGADQLWIDVAFCDDEGEFSSNMP